MTGDFSRRTFDATKHYSSVQMQQGRVQLDADANEAAEILRHRIETEALDLIGRSGGPLHAAGFRLIALPNPNPFTPDELAHPGNDPALVPSAGLAITAGRYYVDGILCENDQVVPFDAQPDLPSAPTIDEDLYYLAYLDVWQRHVTVLEDPSLREVALGGPDTTTRTKTVWQVKLWSRPGKPSSCEDAFADLLAAQVRPGNLRARADSGSTASGPCIVPPSAGYRGLENQLYRVEVHHGGKTRDLSATPAGKPAKFLADAPQITVAGGGSWKVGEAVELYNAGAAASSAAAIIVAVTGPIAGNTTLTLSGDLRGLLSHDGLLIYRADCTYKWSRDNASVASLIERISENKVIVHDLGRDTERGFKRGQWVEIVDDRLELSPQPDEVPQLFQILDVDQDKRIVYLAATPAPLHTGPDGVDHALRPKLRRWDGIGVARFHPKDVPESWLDLEDGVQIRFDDATYRPGDHWAIPARAATADAQTGNVEWPAEGRPPFGVDHHLAALAILHAPAGELEILSDCRRLFPPVTELTSFFYLGGDGQETKPDLTQDSSSGNLTQLPAELRVGVANGSWPVVGAIVEFTITNKAGFGPGLLTRKDGTTDTAKLSVPTDKDGVAACVWSLGPSLTDRYEVLARLLDATGKPVHLPIRFSAHRSIASQVAYDPGSCEGLSGKKDVQAAIDTLARLPALTYVGGDGQSAMPGDVLAHPLVVEVRSACGPLAGARVRFTAAHEGRLGNSSAEARTSTVKTLDIATTGAGLAECWWLLDPDPAMPSASQELTAELLGPSGAPLRVLRFTANLSVAAKVAYDPKDCDTLKNVTTVQEAIDSLCRRTHGGCCVTVGPGGEFARLDEAIRSLLGRRLLHLCVCLSPGEHEVDALPFDISRGNMPAVHLHVHGAGPGSRLRVRRGDIELRGFGSVHLSRFAVVASQSATHLHLRGCDDVWFDGMDIDGHTAVGVSLVRVEGAQRLDVVRTRIRAGAQPRSTGLALTLADSEANALISDCEIIGRLSLYGESTTTAELDWQALLRNDPFRAQRLRVGQGDLRLRNNRLQEVRLGDDISPALLNDRGEPAAIYRSLIADGNVFAVHRTQMQLLAHNLSLGNNVLMTRGDVGICIAAQAKYLGNFAFNDVRLFNIGNTAEKFGNGPLNIVP